MTIPAGLATTAYHRRSMNDPDDKARLTDAQLVRLLALDPNLLARIAGTRVPHDRRRLRDLASGRLGEQVVRPSEGGIRHF